MTAEDSVWTKGRPVNGRRPPGPGGPSPAGPDPGATARGRLTLDGFRQGALPAIQLMCVVLAATALALAGFHAGRHPSTSAVAASAPEAAAVVSTVFRKAGDHRTLEDICAAYDIPARQCEISRACEGARAQASGGDNRPLRLVLRGTARTCG